MRGDPSGRRIRSRLWAGLLASLPPLLALGIQWPFWDYFDPYVWFLFYPAVFLSSWMGGRRAGLLATVLSTALVWACFLVPEFRLTRPAVWVSTGLFMAMGFSFAVFHGRLREANRRASEALDATRTAKEEITRLYERTKELDEIKTQFFANVSHELRTPLALILGPAERTLQAPDVTATARRDLEIVVHNARTLLRHVNDLLDVARFKADPLDYADVDLTRLVRFAAGHFDVLASERKLAYQLDVPDGLRAQVDPAKVQRVLINLLSNAFKFTPDGGRVRLSARAAGGWVAVEIADSGPGIPPGRRSDIFDSFRQLEGGPTRRFGGIGLGLAIARDLINLHGGAISVDESPEGGALFLVRIPQRAPAGAEVRLAGAAFVADEQARPAVDELRQRRRPTADLDSGEGARVLVIEDNVEMNRFVCEELSSEYRVSAAYDGAEGLRKALELEPDLIVTDIMMPEMSGDDLVHAIREHRELDGTPIVLLTAKADDELLLGLLREGAQDYLTKPFAVDELRSRIHNLLASKGAVDSARHAARSRDEVLGVVAHELRNSLSTILMQAALLQQSGADPGDKAAARLERATGQMNRQIEDLLDVTRIEAGHLSVERSRISAGQVLSDCADSQRAMVSAASLELVLDVEQDLPDDLWADRQRLVQALENLVGNARKFTEAGGRIELGARRRDGDTLLWVADTGVGLLPEEKSRVFDRFFRGAQAGPSGAGLGLTIVRGIVEAHGGRVWVDSAPGRGSTFFFTIPRGQPGTQDRAGPPPETPPGLEPSQLGRG